MESRFYNTRDINIELVAQDVVRAFSTMGYQAQHMGDSNQVMIQLRKGSDLEAFIGMQAALTLTIQRTSAGTMAMVGQQKWVNKAATGAASMIFPILWPLAITTGFGVVRQINLANQVFNMIDGLIHQQAPHAQSGPAPAQNPEPSPNPNF
jgi:deoxyhypusine synthase